MKDIVKLRAELALLQSKVDYLETDMCCLHDMLTRCGFPEGVKTLKETVQEILEAGGVDSI